MDKKKSNILVTGANGQLGCAIRKAAAGSRHHFIYTDVNEVPGQETVYLDICNPDTFDLVADSEDIDVIVNCASYTNVEKAEDESGLAELLNAKAVAGMAATARRRNAVLIHISTDYVFGGDACSPIPEDAEPAPLSVYGATKLAGEKAVRDSACRHIILRTAWLYSRYGKNFVKTMKALTASNPVIKVVADQVGTPTRADDLAGFIVGIIENGQLDNTGTYNFTDEGVASWYDLAHEVCTLAGNSCDVQPCSTSEYKTRAARPMYSVLDKSKVKKTFGISLPYWRDSLAECMKELSE